jgi:hypothetical protein
MATHQKSTNSQQKATAKRSTKPAKKNTKNKSDEDLPGYPKYGAEEDITNKATRIDENLDDEVLTKVKHHEELKQPKINPDEGKEESEPTTKNQFDVTEEDMEALGPKDLSLDMGDDEQLKHRNRPVDFTGEDLDVPGTELDDDQEERASEDEENNIYSLGGDEKNNLEESQEHESSI